MFFGITNSLSPAIWSERRKGLLIPQTGENRFSRREREGTAEKWLGVSMLELPSSTLIIIAIGLFLFLISFLHNYIK